MSRWIFNLFPVPRRRTSDSLSVPYPLQSRVNTRSCASYPSFIASRCPSFVTDPPGIARSLYLTFVSCNGLSILRFNLIPLAQLRVRHTAMLSLGS